MCTRTSFALQTGTLADDSIRGAAIGSNGTYVFAGNTRGDLNGTNAGSYDRGAFKIDVEGDIVWTWQVIPTQIRQIRTYL